MKIDRIGEFGLIRRIRKRWGNFASRSLIQGMGDDVAVIELGRKTILATTDIMIEGVHFELSWMDPYGLGRKALAVNLSDIASMGGTPRFYLVSIGLPKDLPASFVSRLYRGLERQAREFRVGLIGGDTSASEKIVVNICLLGEGDRKALLFRNGAKVGDDIYVSGTLGDSALGLKILQSGTNTSRKARPASAVQLVRRHLLPTPRVRLGQMLARARLATAMIDLSDGLLGDLWHILDESDVGAIVREDSIPLSSQYRKLILAYSQDPLDLALRGGEDYELLFTASPGSRERILSLSRSIKIPLTRIGNILPRKEGFRVIRKDSTEYTPARSGFDHFV